jgi:ABC-type nitrate/sulfonate/bicarbonate transport system substrate-binding protein
MDHYAGIDVSLEQASVCVVDGSGKIVLEKGTVDATAIPAILLRTRGAGKYRVVIGPKDLPRLPPAIGIATTALMQKRPARLRALIAGRREAVQFIYQHPDEATKILSKVYAPIAPDDVASRSRS